MVDTKYSYTFPSSFPNGLDSLALSVEIRASSISSASLLYINRESTVVDIWFNGALSAPDQTTLTNVVNAHTGQPLQATRAMTSGATRAPNNTDDSSKGCFIGMEWVDTTNDEKYVCFDATVNAAVWVKETVESHAELSNLNSDDHSQYMRTDGSRTMTGNLNLGNFNITNAGSINGVNVVQSVVSTKEPTGFENRTDSTISFTNATRTFSIQPSGVSYNVWYRGTRSTKTTTETIVVPNVEGLHVIYFDSNFNLTTSNTISVIEGVIEGDGIIVAAVYWNATDARSEIFMEERHGITMDGATHRYLHNTVGSRWISGGALTLGVVDGNGSANTHLNLSVSDVSFADEDIIFSFTNGAPQTLSPIAQIPVYYRLGANGDWRKKTADDYPVIQSGTAGYTGANSRIAWNQFTGSTWQLTQIGELNYMVMIICATNSITEPVIAFCGQNEYLTIQDARFGADTELQFIQGTSRLLSYEISPLGCIIVQSSTAYTNAPRAALRSHVDGLNYLDTRYNLLISAASNLGKAEQLVISQTPWKYTCRTATTGNITLSGTQTIDGVAVVVGDRVLVRSQSTGSQNGIYIVQSGAWIRATDFDTSFDSNNGVIVYTREGSSSADMIWALTTENITLGTTSLSFAGPNASNANPNSVGTSNSQGTSNRFARQDHTHSHGNISASTTAFHGAASGTSVGFIIAPGSNTNRNRVLAVASGADTQEWRLITNANVDAAAAITVNKLAAGTDSQVLTTSGSTTQWSAQTAIDHGSISGLADDDHAQYLLVSGTRAMTGSLNMGTNTIINVVNPTNPQDVATKNYVDTTAATLTSDTPAQIDAADSAIVGVATTAARADHQHAVNTALVGDLVAVDAGAAAAGTSATLARGDHKHTVSVGTPTGIGTANAAGSATTLVRSDHVHALSFTTLNSVLGTADAAINVNSQRITGVASPTSSTDAINLTYFDRNSKFRDVRAATTANITLSGPQTIDGVLINAGEVVLVKNQTNNLQNGVYVASGGAWTRETWADSELELLGLTVIIREGTQAGTIWHMDAAPPVNPGAHAITFSLVGNYRIVQNAAGTNQNFRHILQFTGNATVTDDAANDRTIVNITGSGSGDVVGPASSTANAIATFANTTGKLLQNNVSLIRNTDGAFILGTDLSLIPISGNQSVISTWWGLQLVGNRQATVNYSPSSIGTNSAYGVLIPNQQSASVALMIRGASSQSGNLTQWENSGGTTIAAINSSGQFDAVSKTILNVADPVNAQDAATKNYVDVQGYKVRCRAATTANITLSGAQTIDGVSVIAGDRVLVKNQSTGSQNGIYVAAAGAWSRAVDADSAADFNTGFVVKVSEGTVNADTLWTLTTNPPITLGTTSLAFGILNDSTAASPAVSAAAAVQGTSVRHARQDHTHQVSTGVVNSLSVAAVAAEGSSNNLARADHTHGVPVGTPVAVGSANAAGSATTFVRSDHVHQASYQIIQNSAGTNQTARFNLQFTGAGVAVSDDAANSRTVITIAGGSGLTAPANPGDNARIPWANAGNLSYATNVTLLNTGGLQNALRMAGVQFSNAGATPAAPTGSDGTLWCFNGFPTWSTPSQAFNLLRAPQPGNPGEDGRFARASGGTLVYETIYQSLTRTLPTVIGDFVEIGTLNLPNNGIPLFITISTPSSSFSVSKIYKITTYFSADTDWMLVYPDSDTGDYGGNDYDLLMRVNSADVQLRLRRRLGTTAGVAHIQIYVNNQSGVTFTGSTATGTVALPNSIYNTPEIPSKFRVRVATTADITLSGTQTIDGISLAVGDRVLVRAQSSTVNNGIYQVNTGAWTRTFDANTGLKLQQCIVRVQEGTTFANTTFVNTNQGAITIGSTAIGFSLLDSTITHNNLSGLTSGDPHTQYLLVSGTRAMTGALNMNNQNIVSVKNATFNAEYNHGNSGASTTIDWNNGQKQRVTLTSATVTISFTAPPGPCNLMLKVIQDATGSRTVNWASTVRWAGGTAPTLTTTAARADLIALYYDGTNYLSVASLNFNIS